MGKKAFLIFFFPLGIAFLCTAANKNIQDAFFTVRSPKVSAPCVSAAEPLLARPSGREEEGVRLHMSWCWHSQPSGESACPAFFEGLGDLSWILKILFVCTTHLKERQLLCTSPSLCIHAHFSTCDPGSC